MKKTRGKLRNRVALNPLLGKGGEHRRSHKHGRQQAKRQLRRESGVDDSAFQAAL